MEYNHEKIKEYWNRYIAGFEKMPDHLEGLDDRILNSWKRSVGRINPYSAPTKLSKDELQKLIEDNETLIKVALPYMIKFYQVAQTATQNVLLADNKGRQLMNVSAENQDLKKLMSKALVENGIDYSEESCGTSSLAVCLHEDSPILLQGYEHYRSLYHDLSCFSAPIHSLGNQQLGSICITGKMENYQPFIMSALIIMIQAIENELRLTQANAVLQNVVDNISQGFILLDSSYNIMQYNAQASKNLEINTDLSKHNLNDFFIDDFSLLPRSSQMTNYTLTKKNHFKIPLSLQFIPLQENSQKDMYLMMMSSFNDLKEETSRKVGYLTKYSFDDIIGESMAINKIKELGHMAAKTDSNVLIIGESGTGKELTAQAIHNDSLRKKGSFVTIHCSAIPNEMMEMELFGDEKNYQMGKIELAENGTLFLDEIEYMSFECQSKLFEFLNSKVLHQRKIDVRIIASTQIDLLHRVNQQLFKGELYYKLNVLHIVIPPLRQRRDDIMPLVSYYLNKYCKILKKEITGIEKECSEVLVNYNWLGNIRELESTMEHLINISKTKILLFNDLPSDIVTSYMTQKYTSGDTKQIKSPEIVEYSEIVRLLKQEHGHMKTVAQLLDMPLSTLYRKCNKYNIEPKQYKAW